VKLGEKLLPVLILGAIGWGWLAWSSRQEPVAPAAPASTAVEASAPAAAAQFRSGEQLEASGVVERVLADDNDGSRHQRFIVRLASGQTLLIAHNIDLAPRVAGLASGDTVTFSGVYEPNDKGGVVHWTHHDPAGRHTAGWIEHKGQRYQ
jgi:hypothetical protein